MLDPEAVPSAARRCTSRRAEESARHPERVAPAPEEALLPVSSLRERLQAAPSLHLREVDPEGAPFPCPAGRCAAGRATCGGLVADLRASAPHTTLLLGNAGRAERLRELLFEEGLRGPGGEEPAVDVRVGALSSGFELTDAGQRVLADGDVFPEEVHLHARARGRGARSFLSDFRDLKVGDLVVHQDHGIGRFEGLERWTWAGSRREFMVLAYQGGDKLKVPVEAFDRIQKYQRGGRRPRPRQDGRRGWEKVKRRVKKAMRDMAADLLSSTPSARRAPDTPSPPTAPGSASSRRPSTTRRRPTRPPPSRR